MSFEYICAGMSVLATATALYCDDWWPKHRRNNRSLRVFRAAMLLLAIAAGDQASVLFGEAGSRDALMTTALVLWVPQFTIRMVGIFVMPGEAIDED